MNAPAGPVTAAATQHQQSAHPTAKEYLSQFLGRTLRVTASDGRVFVGQMKCTDRECNIILALTQEYRPPSDEDINRNAIAAAGSSTRISPVGKINMPFTSRYVGLVVVPGKHITKIELEEWARPGAGVGGAAMRGRGG